MGMFDYIDCKYPLPDKEAQDLGFQTKSLNCTMTKFEINEAGRLIEYRHRYAEDESEVDSIQLHDYEYHGYLNFYTSTKDNKWYQYKAKFTDGTVVNIVRCEPYTY